MLEEGYAPGDIGFVAFTRKAANEARTRAREKFKLNDEDLPWFRTFHSLAFNRLGMSKHQVMGISDYLKICGQLGISITFNHAPEDGNPPCNSRGDRLFFMENMARAQLLSLQDYWEKFPNEDIYLYELKQLAQTLREYKAANGKRDFTDVIIEFCRTPVPPPLKKLIIDEAQDLTPLQWKMAELLSRDVDEVYVAGDDDQAIFRWAGADVEHFMNLPGDRVVLPRSYRVPQAIQVVAEEVVNRITARVPKLWEPADHQGEVIHVSDIAQIDMSRGNWMLLARNVYLLNTYCEHCIRMGHVFDSSTGSPIRGSSMEAIRCWEILRKGESVSAVKVRLIYDLMSIKVGVAYGNKTKVESLPDESQHTLQDLRDKYGLLTDKIWHEALDRIPWQEREYFLSALRSGEKLLKEPRIKINTIHGVKGGEADNVVIMTDMAQRTYAEYQENEDDEHRVWYVAVTRARQKLFIVTPRTNMSYTI